MKKKLIAMIIASAITLSLVSCDNENVENRETEVVTENIESTVETEDSHYPVTISNYNYEGEEIEITFHQAPEKVVSVYQGSIETMIALGLEEYSLASYGLDNEVKEEWQEGFEQMNYDETVFAPDKETVTLLEPDFIFSWGSYFADEKLGAVEEWHEKGTTTYINSNTAKGIERKLENEYTDILNIGKIFNVEEKAEELVNEMKADIEEVISLTQGQEATTVVMLEPVGDTITNYSKETLGGDMVLSLGGELAKPEGNTISKEELLAANPEVIFVVYMAYKGDDPETVKADQLAVILDDPALQSLTAIENERVYLIMLGDMYASGPRTIDGIRTITEGMYPELTE